MKKLFALVLSLVMMLSLAVPCAAAEETAPDWSGMNVTPVNPMMGLTPYGVNYPTETHYPNTNGPLSFRGNAAYSMLWLNKMLLGCNRYYVWVENMASTTLTITVRRQASGDYTQTVAPYDRLPFYITASPDEIVCMSFNAPSNFSGSVSCACY